MSTTPHNAMATVSDPVIGSADGPAVGSPTGTDGSTDGGAVVGGAGSIVGVSSAVAMPGPVSPVQSLATWYVTGCVTRPTNPERGVNVTIPVTGSTT